MILWYQEMQLTRFVHYTLFSDYNRSYLKLQMQEIQVPLSLIQYAQNSHSISFSPSLISDFPLENK